MLSRKKESVDEEQCEASRLHAEERKHPKNPQKAAMLLVILVALMTCIFATLDNAVTMAHAEGTMDIGQWPRLLLACSGLAAGWIFDLGKKIHEHYHVLCHAAFDGMCSDDTVWRTIPGGTCSVLFVRRVLCRLFYDGIPGSFHEDEEACTVGRYGAGDQ